MSLLKGLIYVPAIETPKRKNRSRRAGDTSFAVDDNYSVFGCRLHESHHLPSLILGEATRHKLLTPLRVFGIGFGAPDSFGIKIPEVLVEGLTPTRRLDGPAIGACDADMDVLAATAAILRELLTVPS
jgi:hypothetical protein